MHQNSAGYDVTEAFFPLNFDLEITSEKENLSRVVDHEETFRFIALIRRCRMTPVENVSFSHLCFNPYSAITAAVEGN